jgi:hypothetical protein
MFVLNKNIVIYLLRSRFSYPVFYASEGSQHNAQAFKLLQYRTISKGILFFGHPVVWKYMDISMDLVM